VSYIWQANQQTNKFHPVYPGFRLVAGHSTRRSFSGSVEDQAVSYTCLGNPYSPEMNRFPTDKYFCSNGLRVQLYFPMCWNGKDMDSPDHQSHMAYSTMYNGGDCPPTHPELIPIIFFEVSYSVDKFPHGKGTNPFVWSCGDPTGYGFHGDFLGGWDPDVMQAVINNPLCDISNPNINFGNNVKACPPLAPYVQDTPDYACLMTTPVPLTEDLGMGHPIPELPGCNPLSMVEVPVCHGPISPSKAKAPRYLFKSKLTGKYVSANPPGTKNPMIANVVIPTLAEIWNPNPVPGGVCLQNEENGQFASTNGLDGMLSINRGSVSTWETFKIIDQLDGYSALQSYHNNQYIKVTEQGYLVPTATMVTDDCLFSLEIPDGGRIM